MTSLPDSAPEPGALQMTLEQMLASGAATIESMARRLAEPHGDPVLRRSSPEDMRSRLPEAPPEGPTDFAQVLDQVLDDVLPFASRTDHPGYFAVIPSFTTWPAVMAELISAAANPYCGAWMEAAGPAQVELDVLAWFRDWLGMPSTTSGVLVSGGSAANLTALMVARTTHSPPGSDPAKAVVYVSDQGHSSMARSARVLGLAPDQLRVLPTDEVHRMSPDTVAAAIAADRRAGRWPLAVCGSAGSTNSGAVDPLAALADSCAEAGVWFHVDAAYGGFAALTERGREQLRGIERADSVTLDPHKWLFQPMECGGVLIREGAALERTFGVHADYLNEARGQGLQEVDFSDRGLQLSRGFRALKIWVSVQTFGVGAFRAAIDDGIDLAMAAECRIRDEPTLELLSPASLGVVCFRRTWADADEDMTNRRNAALVTSLERSGRALVSTTLLHGRYAVRLCILNPTSGIDDVEAVLRHFVVADLPAQSEPPATRPARTGGAVDTLSALPLFASLDARAIDWLASAGGVIELPAGEAVIEQWSTDRVFYVILAGEVEVTIDGRPVRQLAADDFFGELAARDWGAGYGYARLATVTTTQATRLFALPGEAFAALLERSPQVQRNIDAATRDRLRVR